MIDELLIRSILEDIDPAADDQARHIVHFRNKTAPWRIAFPIEQHLKAAVHAAAGDVPKAIRTPWTSARQIVPWGVMQIHAPTTWKRSAGSGIKIGVIDTGIDYYHPDLSRSIGGGVNLIHPHLLPFDDNGHGTHIAGTISAASQGHGIVGVAPQASIYAVKAFDHNGTAYVSDIIYGIDWCVRHRMDVINMSFGMKTRSAALEAAVRNAYGAGVVIVASSGNDGRSNEVDYPARYPQTISVGATAKNKRVAPFSNAGKDIDIFAPGDNIYSTWLHGGYNSLSGTSMATSHVSGVIALLLAKQPNLSPREVGTILRKNASQIRGRTGIKPRSGEVNALRAVRNLTR